MTMPQIIPLAEAAAFTIGCAVLNARKFDPERVGAVLMLVLSALFFALLIVGTATSAVETTMSEPDELYSVLE